MPLGFQTQVDQLGRPIPRLEQGQAPARPQPQPPSQSPLDTMLQVLQDPRNAWIGVGPFAMARPLGFGAEALRRYKLLGGTPESLNKILVNRMQHLPDERQTIVKEYRAATDLAAPPSAIKSNYFSQHRAMEDAGYYLDQPLYTRHGKPTNSIPAREDWDLPDTPIKPLMESNIRGNAAYDALSRQVGRMLDSPDSPFKKFLKDERGSFNPFGFFRKPQPPDSGGFDIPTKTMEKYIDLRGAVQLEGIKNPSELDLRRSYFDGLEGMRNIDESMRGLHGPVAELEATRLFNSLDSRLKTHIADAATQMNNLKNDTLRRREPLSDFTSPPYDKPLFPEHN